ncbi:cellulase family glycosylhydrolase [Asticcacaulis sp. EMRT-3]|uniref:cellulase family glycosylhydrolase n=1 Tax=Asticcacaulis sp. EMRT-3 TaxID=3040349 RepID=UPI0024AF0E45|nr:cellulase family glycosylhydrolase [Asticcacaulis sp. EMRT-3]MDI7775695.1 cellulase family glycosylhydrolase [Asticcacaulis sp. EMRT-3]
MTTRLRRILTALLAVNLIIYGLTGCASVWRNGFGLLPERGPPPAVFEARDGQIFTPDGAPFIMRGVNLQYGDRPGRAWSAIKAIKASGANIIRLELRANTSAHDLRRALNQAVRLKMPVMVMLWEQDVTCSHDSTALRFHVQALWMNRWAQVLNDRKYQPYLMLNIANEWGTSDNHFRSYISTYSELVSALRGHGYRMPLVIDAADCGQNVSSFLEGRGAALQAADPRHNLILSVHAYNKPWNSREKIDANIDALKATGVPFIIGEFGSSQLVEDGSSVDHLYLMHEAQAKGVGWIAWSWKGNGGASQVLDMSRDYGKARLTQHGEDVVNGPDGLKATAKAAF